MVLIGFVAILAVSWKFYFIKEHYLNADNRYYRYAQYIIPASIAAVWAIHSWYMKIDAVVGAAGALIRVIFWIYVFAFLKFSIDRIKENIIDSRVYLVAGTFTGILDVYVNGSGFLRSAGMVIFSLLILFLCYLPFRRFGGDEGALGKYKGQLALAMWGLAVILLGSFTFVHYKSISEWVLSIVGVLSIFWSAAVLEFIASVIIRRRKTLVSGAFLAIYIIAILFSFYRGLAVPEVKELIIPISAEGKEWDGYEIVLMTDIHLREGRVAQWFRETVGRVNGINPDLILITGDIVEQKFTEKDECYELLRSLKAKDGVFAVSGNHEYYNNAEESLKFIEKTGVRILRNRSVVLPNGLRLVGIDDRESLKRGYPNERMEKAFAGVKTEEPIIFLSHRPERFKEAVKLGADLQLSGHTHMGQIPPMDLMVLLYYDYPYGLYSEKNSWIYTSSGTGIWGMPMRIFSKNEIIKVILKKKSD